MVYTQIRIIRIIVIVIINPGVFCDDNGIIAMSILVSAQQAALPKFFDRRPGADASLAAKAMKKEQQISLADLPIGIAATVTAISSSSLEADIALIQRLAEIGFVPGEKVKVIAHGHPGREPIAVRIGGTTFALRRFEADYIYVVANA